MTTPPRSVLVLHESFGADARPDEVDALVQVREVVEALGQLHWQAGTQEVGLNLALLSSQLQSLKPGCVFNLVESLQGRGELIGLVPAWLATAGVPFTGSPADAIHLSSQKILAKRWMRLHGIPTPDWLADHELPAAQRKNERRWIVKSLWEHASLGLDDDAVVQGASAAERRLAVCRETFGGRWFAEEFIDGREFNISIIEQNGQPRVLPIAEMTFVDYPPEKPKIVGYAAKWDEAAAEYGATQRRFVPSGSDLHEPLDALAKKCWTVFGLAGYARVDVRLDPQHGPKVLEVNANPCLARDAGFAAAAAEAGFRFRQAIEMILHAAVRPGLPVLRRAG